MSSQVTGRPEDTSSRTGELSGAQLGSLFLLLFSALLLGLVVPAVFLSNSDGSPSPNVALAMVIVAWTTLRFSYTAASGERRLTLLCFYIFVYVFIGVQPMMSAWTGRFPHRPALTEAWMLRTFGLAILGLVAFESAYMVARQKRKRLSGGAHLTSVTLPAPVMLGALWIGFAIAILLVVGAVATYGPNIFFGIRGGIAFSESQGPALSQTEWLLIVSGLRGFLAAQLFMSVFLWTRRRQHVWPNRAIRQLRWMLILQGMVNLLISNPLSSARLWSGCIILTILFMATPWRGARTFLIWSNGACLALLGLFSALDPRVIIAAPLLRGEEIGIGTTVRVITNALGNFQADANFDAFQMLGLISAYADEVGYSMGRQILLPLFFWVPRSFWPGKPVGTPDVVAEWLGFSSLNVGSPLWAEGYVNFGMFGVVLILGTFGVLARLCDDHLVRTVNEPAAMLPTIITCFFASNTIILLRGDLATGTMYLQMVVGFTVGLLFVAKRRHGKRSAPQSAQ